MCSGIIHEAKLSIFIGRKAKRVPAAAGMGYIAGYTCVNDVTAGSTKTVERLIISTCLNSDTFCALGPHLETDLDPTHLDITCRMNRKQVVKGNTANPLWALAELVAWVSGIMALMPGDIICTARRTLGPWLWATRWRLESRGSVR